MRLEYPIDVPGCRQATSASWRRWSGPGWNGCSTGPACLTGSSPAPAWTSRPSVTPRI